MTDPTAPEDMTALRAAFDTLSGHAEPGGDPITSWDYVDLSDEVRLILADYKRMQDKLDKLTKGETVLVMSEEDRGIAVTHLSDEVLGKWARWALILTEQSLTPEGETASPVSKIVTMKAVISLASMAHRMNAGEVKASFENGTTGDEEIGNWEIILRQQGPTEAERMLWRFRDFVMRNVSTWKVGTAGHPIWTDIAEILADAGINDDAITNGAEWVFGLPDNRRSLEELEEDFERG